ncbi:MAG: DUF881 domain-containing protein [Clostridia bacterium]|nr:DUF881 domain-containing protein [Clostridia bacterium]
MKKSIWIGIMSVLLGVVLAFQLKIVQQNYLNGSSPMQKSSEIMSELNTVKSEKENLEMQLKDLEARLQEIQQSESSDNALIKKLNDDVVKLRYFSGLTDVKGQGIIITLDNPPEDSGYAYEKNIVYDYQLVLNLINELNAAGAEAISINEQRIIAFSEIRAAGNAININKIPQSTPFVIKAIGNKETLEGAVNQRFGIVSILRENSYFVEVKKYDDIQIPRYGGIIKFNYAKTND